MEPDTTVKTNRWGQMLIGFGWVVCFGASLFTLDGAWQTYRLHVHSSWPVAEARVLGCSVSGSWHYNSSQRAWGKNSYVRCNFAYQAAGSIRQSGLDIGNSIFASDQVRTFANTSTLNVARMREWVARHPAGSLQTVHFNPSRPEEISLAAAEEELEVATPESRLQFGLFGLFAGMILVVIGSLVKPVPSCRETMPE